MDPRDEPEDDNGGGRRAFVMSRGPSLPGAVQACGTDGHLPRLRLSSDSAPVRQRCVSEMRVRLPAGSPRNAGAEGRSSIALPGRAPDQRSAMAWSECGEVA